MPKINYTQRAFNAGELSPKLLARTDFDKYKSGSSVLLNTIPTVQGTLQKRLGTKFVAQTKDAITAGFAYLTSPILVPFTDTNDRDYVLEFGNQYMRVFRADGVIVGGPYELVTPFTISDIDAMQYAQSGDVLYIASPRAPHKLTKNSSSDTDWSISEIEFEWPPFQDENPSASAEFYVSAAEGTGITVTAVGHSPFAAGGTVGTYIKFRDNSIDADNDTYTEWAVSTAYLVGDIVKYAGNVYKAANAATSPAATNALPPTHTLGTVSDGAVDWEYLHSGEGYLKITNYVSPTQATADVIKPLPNSIVGSGNETVRWSFGSWRANSVAPAAVTIYENRLVFGGSSLEPQTVWASVTGDFENFKAGTNDSDSFQYTLGSDELNTIRWLKAGRLLLIGTDKGEFTMSGTRIYEAITPTNVRVARQTNYGSMIHRPIKYGERVFFTENNGRKIREFIYDYQNDSYNAIDSTVLSEHITSPVISNGAKQESPTPILWYPRFKRITSTAVDGSLLGFTYNTEQNINAWHKHVLGGSGKIESVAVIRKENYDQVWMTVVRTINGTEVRYVEYMDPPGEGSQAIEDSHYLDCGIVYDGASTTTITGLSHLEGETVSILADGAVQVDKVVSSGQITLDTAASKVHVGYKYNANMQTMPLVPNADGGTALNSRITTITLRVLNTGEGLCVGPDEANLKEVDLRAPGSLMGSPVPLYSGLLGPEDWPQGFERDARVYVQHNLPLPFELCSVTADIMVYDE